MDLLQKDFVALNNYREVVNGCLAISVIADKPGLPVM